MTLAPVIDLAKVRRRHKAEQLRAMGVPVDQITATRSDTELDELWARERALASLVKLTGAPRWLFADGDTAELVELEAAVVRRLMDSANDQDRQLIYSFGGRHPRAKKARQKQKLKAWGIPA